MAEVDAFTAVIVVSSQNALASHRHGRDNGGPCQFEYGVFPVRRSAVRNARFSSRCPRVNALAIGERSKTKSY